MRLASPLSTLALLAALGLPGGAGALPETAAAPEIPATGAAPAGSTGDPGTPGEPAGGEASGAAADAPAGPEAQAAGETDAASTDDPAAHEGTAAGETGAGATDDPAARQAPTAGGMDTGSVGPGGREAPAGETGAGATDDPAARKAPVGTEAGAADGPQAGEAKAGASGDPAAREAVTAAAERRCTGDGSLCIAVKTYVADVCSTIETAAGARGIDPHFLARLLWKESLFEPSALSPVGAQGIAQFMPETARIVGLDDPFNPAKAIVAAAGYLDALIGEFGNMGLAAVAYNGGERRAATFIAGGTVLPYETQDYVEAITGHNAWKWRDDPPKAVDLRLKGDTPFREACVTLAAKRTLKEFKTPERAWPWGVILASHPRQSGAAAQVNALNRKLRPILGGKRVAYVRKKMRGLPKPVYTAQIGYSSRAQANAFCLRLRQLGGRCIVLPN